MTWPGKRERDEEREAWAEAAELQRHGGQVVLGGVEYRVSGGLLLYGDRPVGLDLWLIVQQRLVAIGQPLV